MNAAKLSIPLTLTLSLLASVAAAGGSWAVTSERLNTTQVRIDRLEQVIEVRSVDNWKEHEAQRLRMQRLEDAFTHMQGTLSEIRSDVKELKRR